MGLKKSGRLDRLHNGARAAYLDHLIDTSTTCQFALMLVSYAERIEA